MNANSHIPHLAVTVMLLLTGAGFVLVAAPQCVAAPVKLRSTLKYAISEEWVRDTIAAFLEKAQSANIRSANNGSSAKNGSANNGVNQERSNGPDQIVPRLAELKIPADLVSSEKDPELEVTSVRRDAFSHDLLIHLRCRRREVCGSFLVLAPSASSTAELLSQNFSAAAFPSGLRPPRQAVTRRSRNSAPPLVEPGKSAVLVLQGEGMRITVPVICLQRGSLAQQVAVRDAQTRKILQAKVVGPGQLWSAF